MSEIKSDAQLKRTYERIQKYERWRASIAAEIAKVKVEIDTLLTDRLDKPKSPPPS